jgi:amino acid adenylation domain-containing protein
MAITMRAERTGSGDASVRAVEPRWQEALAGIRSLPGLPWDARRSGNPRPLRCNMALPSAVRRMLRAGGDVGESSVPRVLVAALAELLRRYAADASVALLVHSDGTDVVPLLLDVSPRESLRGATARVARAESAAAARGLLTPASLRAALRDRAAEEGFAVHLSAGPRARPLGDARLHVTFVVAGAACSLRLASDARWLSASVLRDLAERLVALLRSIAAHPKSAFGAHDLVTAGERALLEGAWAGRTAPYDARTSISAVLRARAAAAPDAIAVEDGARRLTFAELVREATRVAAMLRAGGAGPGRRVGLLISRSAEQVVALAGILESGSTVVPLDSAHPTLRLRRMIDAAALDALLTTHDETARAAELVGDRPIPVLPMSALDVRARSSGPPPSEAPVGGDRAAYVIFTSGSTGEPKGVEIPHRAILRLLRGATLMRLGAEDRVLGVTAATFDVAIFEVWGTLLAGATLVLAPAGLLSIADLARSIESERITALSIPSPLFSELAEFQLARLASLRQLHVGGEAMSPVHARRVLDRYPALRLLNAYGPTESTVAATVHRVRRSDRDDRPVPIGRPIENSTVYLLDANGRLVPPGMVGEIHIGGDGLALGYVGQPERTAERFVRLRLSGGRRVRVYRTGDLARHAASGRLEFVGRADTQVKLRGHRIELEEIEAVLAQAPGIVMGACVLVGEGASRALRAAVVPSGARRRAPRHEVRDAARRFLEERLPAPMVPSEWIVLDRLPSTAHAKIDRLAIAALPPADAAQTRMPAGVTHTAGAAPRTRSTPVRARELETAVAGLWTELLGATVHDHDAGFFEVGGNSLLALRLAELVRVRLAVDLPIVRVFEFPTIAGLAAHLAAREDGAAREAGAAPTRAAGRAGRDGRIAIIGMAGRFPGAESPEALWALLREEREGVRRFTHDELDARIAARHEPNYVPVRGVLERVEEFDAAFFGINPRVADVTDPQHRVLLETAWQAFEHAGVVPGDRDGHTGVFTGVSHDTYLERNLLAHPELTQAMGELAIVFANDKDYSAAHIAHRLDLRGPAVAVQTSSSTSLAAIALAVQALRGGQCDLALAGGASVTVPVRSGHLHEEGGIFSADGHTRTFDERATGTTFGDGVAMLLLARLEDAERDGRNILGVICGVGMSNDGSGRASFSAPTVTGQASCITRAFADAGWTADMVSYVEAHGTATPIGDPIEVEALTRAFAESTGRRRFCWLGSVKSNIGHLTAAAGATGVIKVLQAMRHGWIPATLHVERPNPRIDFERSPFLLPRQGLAWETDGAPRRAGVSSFGVGGTNVHVLIEEHREEHRAAPTPEQDETLRLLPLSARTPVALRARAADLAVALGDPTCALAAAATTLRHGRRDFEYRAAIVGASRADVVAQCEALAKTADEPRRVVARDVILLFPGQGTQTAAAGKALYEANATFRAAIDRCDAAAGRLQRRSLRSWLFAEEGDLPHIAERLRSTDIAQPVLFALEYALGHLVLEAGVRPAAMAGHSIGEFAAAALAGVMTPEDAMRAVVARGRLMAAMPPGAMLAIRLPEAEVLPRLEGGVVIAAVNAPRLCVASGPEEAIIALERRLVADGVGVRRLQTSHAFHSPAMDEAARRFEGLMRQFPLRPPTIPFVSCVTGAPITAAQATDPAYWGRQLREAVRFADGLRSVAGDGQVVLVEAGPRDTLSTLGLQTLAGRAVATALLPARDPEHEYRDFLAAVGALWTHGVDGLTWHVPDGHLRQAPAPLPGYAFDRRRHWVDGAGATTPVRPDRRGVHDLLHTQFQIIKDQLRVLRGVESSTGTGEAGA